MTAEDVMLPVLPVIKRKGTCHYEQLKLTELQVRFGNSGPAENISTVQRNSSIL